MMRVLLTNDDGYFAAGISVLRRVLSRNPDLDVVVVAPDREQSGSSHALTLHRPLRFDEVEPGVYKVDGTPTDCVLLATRGGLPEPPEAVVSGINAGANMGDDVTYSGTVAAAMEGTLLGLPSLAVSLVGGTHFETAAEIAAKLLSEACTKGLPRETLLNVNVPDCSRDRLKGVRVTRQSKRTYHDEVIAKRDPRGRAYFWIAGDTPTWVASDDSDYAAVMSGFVSVTPLHLDLTHHAAIEALADWNLELP